MRILSFNIWDLPLWFVRDRRRRLDGLAQYILDQDIDIVCLQESFDLGHRKYLFERLQKHGYHASATPNGSRWLGRFDMKGGLVIFSRFPISKDIFTPFQRLVNSSMVEFVAGKGILKALTDTPYGKTWIVTTHLNSSGLFMDRAIRLQQLSAVLKSLSKEKDVPVILSGDFNEDGMVDDPQFSKLLQSAGFVHPVIDATHSSAPTYRPENNYAAGINKKNFLAQRIDYIFVRNIDALGLEMSHYHPHYPEPSLSDHEPLVMTLVPNQL